MNKAEVRRLACLRLAVGLLGERSETKWWNSAFCATSSKVFLSPIFPKTCVLAQLRGVTAAATVVHDNKIGVGKVFHLFRLPEQLERQINELTLQEDFEEFNNILQGVDSAIAFLDNFAEDISKRASFGPVRIGGVNSLMILSVWKAVAAYYLSAYKKNQLVLPYFSDII